METGDLISRYQAKSNEELIQLAMDMQDLSPDASDVLAAELLKRRIGEREIRTYAEEEERNEHEERQRKLDSMFPSVRDRRARFAKWKRFRDQTGKWPGLSIAFYILHLLFALFGLLLILAYSLRHGWSKTRFLVVFIGIALADVLISNWVERRIHLHEIARYRATRL